MIDGVFNADKNAGYKKCTFIVLKNSISSKILIIIIKVINIKKTLTKLLKNIFNKKII